MAAQTNNLVLIEAGVPRTLDATNDALSIGAATTFSKVLTVSSGGLAVTGDSSVLGNLTVTGDIVSRGTTNLLINDAIMDLATGNTGTVSTPGGFTVQMNRNSGFTAGTVTTFVAGVVATSNPTFTYTDATSSTLLVADDIVAISGSKVSSNDGLYAVYSVNQASFPQIVTIKGIGLNGTSPSTPFIQNQVTAGTGNIATACKIDLAVVLVADGTSAFTDGAAASYAKGTLISSYKANCKDSDFTPNGAYSAPSATQTLQAAYNGGATITTASSTAIAITLTSGGFTVNGGGAVDLGSAGTDLSAFSVGTATMAVAATSTVDIQAAGAVTVDSSAGAISIGGDADSQAINIGTGAAARTITVGNITGATAVVVNAGTGASSVNVTGAGTFALVAGTGNIDLATNATDHATLVGSVTGVSAFTAQAGTGAMTHTAGGAYDVNAAGALTIDSSAGAISIGGDAVAQAINVGTGAAARTITVGNASGATSVVVNAGTGNIDIGTGAFARTTNIATGAAAQTVTVGSSNTTSTLDLKAGSGYINLQTWTKFKDTAGISVTAGETVTQGQAVYAKFDSATTRYFKASNNDVSDNVRNVYGLCYTGGNAGDPVNLASVPGTVVSTALSGVGTADIGKTVYLGTGGALTLTAPTASATVFKVGYVHSNTGGVSGTGALVFFQPQFISKIA